MTLTWPADKLALRILANVFSRTAVNRTLAYLEKSDGWNYSVEAARAGAAKSYVYRDKPVDQYQAIAAAEKEAVDAQRGLWGPPCFGNTSSTPN